MGKHHYPFTDSSLAFITCDREAACGNACKDTFLTESRKGTCFTLTCHASYFSHKLANWLLLSPALGSHGDHTSLAFLLSGASQHWSKVYHTGIWIAIQLWLSPFSLLEQTFASASFHLLPTWKAEVLDQAMFSASPIPDSIINGSDFYKEYWVQYPIFSPSATTVPLFTHRFIINSVMQ